MIKFSFLTPTRNHLEFIERFFNSIVETTAHPEELEIVLGIDEDDPESQQISHDRLRINKVIIPKGENKNLGWVVQKCFEASHGRYLVQVNDDVVIHTKAWDERVAEAFSAFPDDIALIHVNDLLYKERLCTFPIVSRRACKEIGASPTIYQRYRNDDHIYDVYNMLAYLGYKRIVYLEDVVFEHLHFITDISAHKGSYFESENKRYYTVDDDLMAKDAALYDKTVEMRKLTALHLARIIDEERYQRHHKNISAELQQIHPNIYELPYIHLLSTVKDSYSYRTPELLKKLVHIFGSKKSSLRTTVAVVTANMINEHAGECISRIKKYTSNYDFIILDNNNGGEFSHPREMNKIIKTAETRYLALMDDDVLVEQGWLDGLFQAMDEKTGVVVPLHKDIDGKINYSGAYLAGDGMGTHQHFTDNIDAPREVQCVCTALLLIDIEKCGSLFMDELYRKYFFDIAYGLKIWEAGYKCICTPETTITHIGGATMIRGSQEASAMWQRDGAVFRQQWVRFGRLSRLENNIWIHYPFLKPLVKIPQQINQLPTIVDELSEDELTASVTKLIDLSHDYALFRNLLITKLEQCTSLLLSKRHIEKAKHCKEMWAALIQQTYLPENRESIHEIEEEVAVVESVPA